MAALLNVVPSLLGLWNDTFIDHYNQENMLVPISARAIPAFVVCLSLAASGMAAEALFAHPLHLTREIEDPFTGKSVRVEEYCSADRVVSVRGSRVSIADYTKGELIEIDHERETYSIATFEQIAAANGKGANARSAQVPAGKWTRQSMASRGVAGRMAAIVEVRRDSKSQKERTELALDPSFPLTRSAFEVLIGASYPQRHTPEHDAIIEASVQTSAASRTTEQFAFPLQLITEHEIDGEKIRIANRVLSIDSQIVPVTLLQLPPTRVESPLVERQRLLDELDRLPATRN